MSNPDVSEPMTSPLDDAKLVERLRSALKLLIANAMGCIAQHHFTGSSPQKPGWLADAERDLTQAADRLSSVLRENERLREALEPFAAEADLWVEMGDTRPIRTDTNLTVVDLRRALEALSGGQP